MTRRPSSTGPTCSRGAAYWWSFCSCSSSWLKSDSSLKAQIWSWAQFSWVLTLLLLSKYLYLLHRTLSHQFSDGSDILALLVSYEDNQVYNKRTYRLKNRPNYLLFSQVLFCQITEDMSRTVREQWGELHKFMSRVKAKYPTSQCFLKQDKLYVDNRCDMFHNWSTDKRFFYILMSGCLSGTWRRAGWRSRWWSPSPPPRATSSRASMSRASIENLKNMYKEQILTRHFQMSNKA